MPVNPEKIASDVIAAWMGTQKASELRPRDMMDLRDLFASAIHNLLYVERLEWEDKLHDLQARIEEFRDKLHDLEDEVPG